jgi:hypothetical protein
MQQLSTQQTASRCARLARRRIGYCSSWVYPQPCRPPYLSRGPPRDPIWAKLFCAGNFVVVRGCQADLASLVSFQQMHRSKGHVQGVNYSRVLNSADPAFYDSCSVWCITYGFVAFIRSESRGVGRDCGRWGDAGSTKSEAKQTWSSRLGIGFMYWYYVISTWGLLVLAGHNKLLVHLFIRSFRDWPPRPRTLVSSFWSVSSLGQFSV